MFTFDLGELRALAKSFDAAPERLVSRGQAVILEAGNDLRDEWRSNAEITAGRHGRFYPKALQAQAVGALAVDVGPRSGKQAFMSFEFGSRNQPPHLDGQRALDAKAPAIERRIETLASDVFS